MQYGFNMPTSGPLSDPASLAKLAQEGEAMGFHYATFSDHVVIPRDISARYPYSATGEFPSGAHGERHEQLTEAAFIAGKTKKLGLVLSVMVVPHRPAVLTAKILSTIDVLSEGRLVVGIGAGWLKEEFEALGTPPFEARGKVTDEYLDAMKVLWTEDDPAFDGEYTKFANIAFLPKPHQKPHPPIWIGGESGPALRRTARIGDGWYPIGTNPSFPLDSLKRLEAGVGKARRLVAEAGRDPAALAIAYRVQTHGPGVPAQAGDGERRLFAGDPAAIVADLHAMQDLGVGWVDFSFGGPAVDDALAGMRSFADGVLSKV